MASDDDFKMFPGDSIKFRVDGSVKETGHWMLNKLKDRLFMGVTVYEHNGIALEKPLEVETGFFVEDVPASAGFEQSKDKKTFGFELDPNNLWTAAVSSGIPRAGGNAKHNIFVDPATFVVTDEPAPPREPEVVAEIAAAPAAATPSPAPKTAPAKRRFGGLFG